MTLTGCAGRTTTPVCERSADDACYALFGYGARNRTVCCCRWVTPTALIVRVVCSTDKCNVTPYVEGYRRSTTTTARPTTTAHLLDVVVDRLAAAVGAIAGEA